MRRPGRTPKQKQHDREMRALLRLRKAAVALLVFCNQQALAQISGDKLDDDQALAIDVELKAAAFAYGDVLSVRERRRLSP